jgi:hypothetical protein
MPDVDTLKSIVHLCDQSVLIALDVEYGPFVHRIGAGKCFPDVS